jgi:hypothetical protein
MICDYGEMDDVFVIVIIYCQLPIAYCLLLTANCLLPLAVTSAHRTLWQRLGMALLHQLFSLVKRILRTSAAASLL